MPESLLRLNPDHNDRINPNGENSTMHKSQILESATTTTMPRSLIIVPRSKSQAACRRIAPASVSYSDGSNVVEKHLPNGDLYMGTFHNNAPHGSGKYLWRDGCMYEGEWKKGKASGKGKFSWPSGATFEGEFKSGRMEGIGTFIGADGDSYRGSWCGDKKHGYGAKRYRNGDSYEGQWKRNLQDGKGRYLWGNGNEYVGDWKNGLIHGKGVFVWSNGNRYDGNWENGTPKAPGVFTWSDGSCHVGSWSNDSCKNCSRSRILNAPLCPAHSVKSGVGYGSGNGEDSKGWFSHKLLAPLIVVSQESVDLGGEGKKRSTVGDGTGEGAVPRICIWESDGDAGDITGDILDNVEASTVEKDGFTKDHDGIRRFRRTPCFVNGAVKRPGQTISKGHKNYDLMLNLQLGIRYSVGKHASILHNLKASEFDPKEKFWTRFPPAGSKITPPHQSAEFRWKDYCPLVFRHLRERFGVDPADYMLAVCGNDALREFSSPGKSGSFFYLTQDDRFMIKTLKKSEVKALLKMLPSYYQHVCRYENSLVTKFYSVHCIKPVGGIKTRFIVMGNMFCSAYRIHRRFDLKGSSHGRVTDKREEEIDETTTLKDLDLNFVFRLKTKWFRELMKQIDLDCEFLESEGIMDYSLLVGLHFCNDSAQEKIGRNDPYTSEKLLQNMDRVSAARLGINMPARAERGNQTNHEENGPSRGEICEVVLYLGIIDILQDYDISKRIEHAYKSLQVDRTSISAVDPKLYSRRFQDFVRRIFVEDR